MRRAPMLKRLFSARRESEPVAHVPPGRRLYAIGDIHGRLDLLDAALAKIADDDAARGSAQTTVIVLGDLVDRGPDSVGVVERLRRLAESGTDIRLLLGNHEEVFLLALGGDLRAVRLFCRIGGRETLLSYGVSATEYEALSYEEVAERLAALVPPAHRDFLAAFEQLIVVGDYAFAHAGVRPGVPFADQTSEDLRWIREPFLEHRGVLEKVVVHGHTIRDQPEFRRHRIGIDTGAYASGRLTVLGLEAGERWIIESADGNSACHSPAPRVSVASRQ
jgi:serine/threonine protein phosphatase 1